MPAGLGEIHVLDNGSVPFDKIDADGDRLAGNRHEFGFEIFQPPRQGSIDQCSVSPCFELSESPLAIRHARQP